jgi:hypothetical protein
MVKRECDEKNPPLWDLPQRIVMKITTFFRIIKTQGGALKEMN